jgi:hypothetical protein
MGLEELDAIGLHLRARFRTGEFFWRLGAGHAAHEGKADAQRSDDWKAVLHKATSIG